MTSPDRNGWKNRDVRLALLAVAGIWLTFTIFASVMPLAHSRPQHGVACPSMHVASALLIAAATLSVSTTPAHAAVVGGDEFTYAMSNGEQFKFWVHDQKVSLIMSGTDLFYEGYLCSDEQVLCADLVFGLVAVPKTDLSATTLWKARGWEFRVLRSVRTKWGSGWVIAGKGPKEADEFTYIPGAGLVDLQLTVSDRAGWKSSTPIRLRDPQGIFGGDVARVR